MTSTQMLIEIRKTVDQFPTRHRAALYFDVSDGFLSDVLKGNREPGEKIPAKLGYTKRITYDRRLP